jgi:hypothetical protein
MHKWLLLHICMTYIPMHFCAIFAHAVKGSEWHGYTAGAAKILLFKTHLCEESGFLERAFCGDG